jgi:hypothetical protein
MNQTLLNDWLAALRSNSLKKNQGALIGECPDQYCALGVLCKLIGLEERRGERIGFVFQSGIENDEPPPTWFLSIGLSHQFVHDLIIRNDGKKGKQKPLSFKDLADWIEDNLDCSAK